MEAKRDCALIQRALGYENCEIHTEIIEDEDGNIISRKTKIIKKQIPPSDKELISLLCSLAPDRWRIPVGLLVVMDEYEGENGS